MLWTEFKINKRDLAFSMCQDTQNSVIESLIGKWHSALFEFQTQLKKAGRLSWAAIQVFPIHWMWIDHWAECRELILNWTFYCSALDWFYTTPYFFNRVKVIFPWVLIFIQNVEFLSASVLVQWRPIQMRAFHSNENGLFCTHPSISCPTRLMEGKRQAGSSHLNEKFSFE